MLDHGGNLEQAVRQYGHPRDAWLDLSTGISPFSYPVPALPPDAWHRLPPSPAALEQAACAYYGAPGMLAVAGTQAVIQALPHLREACSVAVSAPSYAEHAHAWRSAGHTVRDVAYDALEAASEHCDVMVVCNPNNPTGAAVPPERLLAWHARLSARGGWLVVDEAFGDCTPSTSIARHADRPGLVVLRSVGKFFGLAGLRLGFVAADAALRTALAERLGPWTVSGPAQEIGRTALADTDWQSRNREILIAAGQRLERLLHGYRIPSTGTTLFQWWPEQRAAAFQDHMAKQAIWVRRFDAPLPGIRLGLPGDEAGWARLAAALAAWSASS